MWGAHSEVMVSWGVSRAGRCQGKPHLPRGSLSTHTALRLHLSPGPAFLTHGKRGSPGVAHAGVNPGSAISWWVTLGRSASSPWERGFSLLLLEQEFPEDRGLSLGHCFIFSAKNSAGHNNYLLNE